MKIVPVVLRTVLCLSAAVALLLNFGCGRSAETESDTDRSLALIEAMAGSRYTEVVKLLSASGVNQETVAAMKGRLIQPRSPVVLSEPFVRAANIGASDGATAEDYDERIRAALKHGFATLFWEINRPEVDWPARFDRELARFPSPPIAVLNVSPAEPRFIHYFKWYDRYAGRVHSVLINADKLDNYIFKTPDEQREANRVLSGLYRLIKARNPAAFVWMRVVWADDQSDIRWLKAMSFEPDGLVLWNLPVFQSPFAEAQKRFRPLVGESTAFLAGEFYGFWSLIGSATNLVEAGRGIAASLDGFAQGLGQAGYRGLAPNWMLFKALEEAQASPAVQAAAPASAPKPKSKRWEWTCRDTVEAYTRVGRTNAAWDKPAKQALELYAEARSNPEDKSLFLNTSVAGLVQAALGAGCDDPVIQYLHIRYVLGPGADSVPASIKAADAMEATGYSAARKFLTAANTLEAAWNVTAPAPNLTREADRFRGLAERHIASVASDETMPGEEVQVLCEQWLRMNKARTNQFAAFQVIEKPLFDHWAHAAWSWLIKGRVYTDYAWEGRGAGWADTVSEQGWRLFAERLGIAEQALNSGWALDPSMKEIAEQMITVELGQGRGRDRMEAWFQKAMQLDTNNYNACLRKLSYLEPKWHGSPEAMVEFGRQCVASKQWGGRVPLILLKAHETLFGYMQAENRTNYWKQPLVWKDIKTCLDRFHELNPQDKQWRQTCFLYACLAEQWEEARKQLPLLEHLDYTYFGGKEAYEKMVQATRSHTSNQGK
jgi:hypothetical protein